MPKVTIIAEAGVNHNGDFQIAKELVDKASEAGADYVKFQLFKSAELVSANAEMAEYQKKNTGKEETQLEMIRKLELSESDHIKLQEYCEHKNIGFMSSPFGISGISFLDSIGIDFFKVPSGEITNLPYLRELLKYQRKVILSTGMSSMDEVRSALDVLSGKDVTVLHCNTEYPTPMQDVNLRAMLTIKDELGVKVGYSDHTKGIEVAIAAVAMGAEVIEKHFTINKNMEGPDHKASLDPEELSEMVRAIRNIEVALGDGRKVPSESEKKNIPIARKSIVAARKIVKGELFSSENITIKRPGNGISPMQWDDVLGLEASQEFEKDELIKI